MAGPTVITYFGPRWHAPILDDARHAPTPVGHPCLRCREPIADGDRGFVRAVWRRSGMPVDAATLANPEDLPPDGVASIEPIHAECEAIGVVGHQYGVCTCTGWDTSSRAAARELWQRLGHTT